MKQVIILRKDLNMRKGKMVAQGAHASLSVILDRLSLHDDGSLVMNEEQVTIDMLEWINGDMTKICVSVDSEQELLDIYNKAKELKLPCSLIKDLGYTEFKEPTYTAVAIGPGNIDLINSITKNLKLL